MATTVTTLNGGPSGGLSTTTSSTTTTTGLCSINTNSNSPEDTARTTTTTRVVIEGEQGEERLRLLDPSPTNENDDESVQSGEGGGAIPPHESTTFLDSAAIKKRRKQSRPVRIPLTGSATTSTPPEGEGSGGHPPTSSLTLSVKEGGSLTYDGSPCPLNLSKTEQQNSVLLLDPTHNNNNNNNHHHHHQHHLTSSPSFSPILFPLSSSSPFSGLFPGFLPPGHTPLNPPSGTPTSSSSNGSINNNNNNNNNNNTNNNNNNNNHGHSLNNSSSMSSNRIFNPEAYCDLCNKEFCNKYFLKTHKANKHGVYTDQQPQLPNVQSTLPFLSALTTTCQQKQQFSSVGSTGQGPDSSFFGSMTSDLKSRDSFCHLCKKDFCNKYFLKRHKAKIHGVPDTDSLPTSDHSNGNRSHLMSSKSGSGDEEGEVFRHGQGSSGGGRSNDEEMDNDDSEGEVGLDLGPSPQEILKKTSPERIPESDFKMAEEEQHQVGLSPEDGAMMNNRTSAICACQLCFREFTTQSALRSHLEKKHGLLIPSTFPPSFLLPFANMASPLLFDESGGLGLGGVGVGVGVGGGSGDHRHNDTHSPSDLSDCFECSLCNRTFQTVYLLRMHKSYFHPDTDEVTADHKYRYRNQPGEERERDREREGTESDVIKENNKGGANSTIATPPVKLEVGTEDSDDLRRLQSMIMELNRVSAAGTAWSPPPPPTPDSETTTTTTTTTSPTTLTVCPICSKEFYSTYYLTQHMAQCHSSVVMSSEISIKSESPNSEQQQQQKQPLHPWSDLPGDLSSSRERESFLTPGKSPVNTKPGLTALDIQQQQQQGKRPSPSLSRSYCTICHKELCNKYFMRTHMLKMHGISIESSTGLGGVTCDICNKELCSKYFLKVHKQNTHGIVEEGPSPPAASTTPLDTPLVPSDSPLSNLDSLFQQQPDGRVGSPSTSTTEGGDVHTRYFSHYSEVCPICTRRFRSSKWLKTHLVTDHGQEGREKWKTLHASRRGQPSQSQSPGVTVTNKTSGKSTNGGQRSSSSGKRSQSPSKGRNNGGEVSGKGGANKCVLCGVNTPDIETLKMHILKEHGDELKSTETTAVDFGGHDPRGGLLDPLNLLFQKMDGGAGGSGKLYRCSYCPFTTTLLVYLYAHERTHTGLANPSAVGLGGAPLLSATTSGEQPLTAPLRCPMCFHTFQQLEAFQQHLIGHQMSGVLAPFFAPTAPFSTQDHRHLLQSSRHNGSSEGNPEMTPSIGWPQFNQPKLPQGGEKSEGAVGDVVQRREKGRKRKRRKIVTNFQCSQCPQLRFGSRAECAGHIEETHGPQRGHPPHPPTHTHTIQGKFRCRLCKFQALTYQSHLVHSRIHHSTRSSPISMEHRGQPRVMLQEGTSGDFILQRFFLRSTTDEEEEEEDNDESKDGSDLNCSKGQEEKDPPPPKKKKVPKRGSPPNSESASLDCNKSGYFVPSIVYLPVREKVSQALRVSFSLTPTS